MLRIPRLTLAVLCVLSLLAGCATRGSERVSAAHDAEIDALLHAMSPAEKVGQLLMIGVDGTGVTPAMADLLRTHRPGGIILFRKNVRSPAQVAALTNALQRAALDGARIPLLIATDQEGGTVSQAASATTEFPDAMALAAAGSEDLVERVARAGGAELRALGINVNLAPVLDVNSNPRNPVIGIRSFGDDPATVARFGRAYIRGLHAAGVLGAAKHFPGHGDTEADTHFAMARVSLGTAALERSHLIPFRAAIREGVDMIMPAHLVVPALSGSTTSPITFSHRTLTGYLRERMGFGGVVITDSLQMAAALQEPFAAGCVRAVKAGADVLLLPGNLPSPDPARAADLEAATRIETAYAALFTSLSSNGPDALTMTDVDAAVRRVLRLKKHLHASFAAAEWLVDEARVAQTVRTAETAALAREAAARGLAWLTPLPDGARRRLADSARLFVLSAVVRADPDSGEARLDADAFGDTLAAARPGRRTDVVAVPFYRGRRPPPDVDEALVAALRAQAQQADAIVVGIARAEHLRLLQAVQSAAGRDVPIVVVQFGSPYIAASIREPVTALLATFSVQRDAFAVAAEALAGTIAVTGTAPVSVFDKQP